MWNKLKSSVDTPSFSSRSLNPLHRSEKDKSEHDTILSRSMLRYYGEETPQWLADAQASQTTSMRIPKPSLNYVTQPAATLSRTSLDFLNKSRPSPVPRENPITALTQGLPSRNGSKNRGRLGEKLRGSNW